jgi:hypothetical protein
MACDPHGWDVPVDAQARYMSCGQFCTMLHWLLVEPAEEPEFEQVHNHQTFHIERCVP